MSGSRRGSTAFVRPAAFGVVLLLSGCSVFTEGSQPTKTPVGTPSATASSPAPTQPSATAPTLKYPEGEAIPLAKIPAYRPSTPDANGWRRTPMFGSSGSYRWRVLGPDGRPETKVPGTLAAFGPASEFTHLEGVLTLRGNPQRTAPVAGTTTITDKTMTVAWEKPIGTLRSLKQDWGGAGWTGQPLLVKWPEQTKKVMGLPARNVADADFVEVLYPTFSGNVYRLDLATGSATRPPMKISGGFKGTGSIDPRGYPLLYAGQGLQDDTAPRGPWQYRIFDLISNRQVSGWSGSDPLSPRSGWGAFDSSALVHAGTDTLVEPSENGLIYKVKLNSSYDPAAKKVSVNPRVSRLQYSTPRSHKHGIESSSVAYRNLMFASDNDGNLLAWDINTMTLVWVRDVGDDSDATMALEETPTGAFLYTGNSVDQRGHTAKTNLRKVNALTGALVWQHDVPTVYSSDLNGGLLGSPILGKGPSKGLVFFSVAMTTSTQAGEIMALDVATGKTMWSRTLANYSWTSPLLIDATDGAQYGLFCDSVGTCHLFDPRTGKDHSTLDLGSNVEATPAVFGNTFVVATRAAKIFAVTLK